MRITVIIIAMAIIPAIITHGTHWFVGARVFASFAVTVVSSPLMRTVSLLSMVVSCLSTLLLPLSLLTVFSGYCLPRLSGGSHNVSRSTTWTVSIIMVWLTVDDVSVAVRLCRRWESLRTLLCRWLWHAVKHVSHRTIVSMRATLNLPDCRL